MTNLLSLSYWFSTRPVPLSSMYFKILLVLFCAFFVFSILLKLVVKFKKKDKMFDIYTARLFNKSFSMFFTVSLLGLAWLFFSYERTPILSMRFLFAIIFIVFVIWLVFVVKYLLKIPGLRKELNEKKEFEKYLPK